jgi:hypothetical protein
MQVSFPNPEEPAGAATTTRPYAFQRLHVFVLSLSWHKRAFLFSCEISTKRTPVSFLSAGLELAMATAERSGASLVLANDPDAVRKTPLFEQFIHKNDRFTKTGSGQT